MSKVEKRQAIMKSRKEYADFKRTINNPVTIDFERLEIEQAGGLQITQFKKNNFRPITGMERAGLYRSNSKGYAKNYNPNLTEGRTH